MFICATSQKRHLMRVILFVNYCLFANGDVSIRFNGKYDKVVLEIAEKNEFKHHTYMYIKLYIPTSLKQLQNGVGVKGIFS